MGLPVIEGLTALAGPIDRSRLQNTIFSLPVGFDTNKYAAKWEEKGNPVSEAQQPTFIESIGAQADGWQIYKVLKNPRKTLSKDALEALTPKEKTEYAAYKPEYEVVERVTRKSVLILMFRPKVLQQALNIVYANQSRALVGGEVEGDGTSVNEGGDQGILTNKDLERHYKGERGEHDGYLPQTPISRPTEAAEIVV